MLDILLIPVAVVYLLVVGLLFLYGVNFFYLTYLAIRYRWASPPQPRPPDEWPHVTVQLPIYNEMYVAERLMGAAAALDYPAERLEIQVLDDSTDETAGLVAAAVERLKARGVNIVHLHRSHRQGYKAGALAEGFEAASGEFLAIFDADFIPPPDFLQRALPHFHDPKVAFVQARWGHINSEYSLLTYLQSLAIDAHFMVEQFARSRGGFWFNFNGTAGVWRRAAIQEAGGWTADTLTEDLDLSYRAFLKGWQAVYLRDLEAPAELPVTFGAFRRQQHRWARGSFEVARKLLPKVWNSAAPLRLKLEGSLHLTGYFVHLLLFALCLLYPLVILMSLRFPSLISLFGIALAFNFTAFAPTAYFIVAQHQLGRRWVPLLPVFLFMSAFGAGMMLNTVRAGLQIFQGKSEVFERTPKFGIVGRSQEWLEKRYQLSLDPIVYSELFFGLVNVGTIVLGVVYGNWIISIYAALFAFGLFFTSLATIAQSIRLHRKQARRSLIPEQR